MAESETLLTRHEAARAAGVTLNTILLWIRAGRLNPVAEPGRNKRVIRLSELQSAARPSDTARRRRTTQVWEPAPRRSRPPSAATRSDANRQLRDDVLASSPETRKILLRILSSEAEARAKVIRQLNDDPLSRDVAELLMTLQKDERVRADVMEALSESLRD